MAYGVVSVLPNLTMPLLSGDRDAPVAAKTVPSHFSPAYPATAADVQAVFGQDDAGHFWIGNPLDMDTKVCLDLDALSAGAPSGCSARAAPARPS